METKHVVLFAMAILFAALATSVSAATECWRLNSNQTGCGAASDCVWRSDPYGSWCEQAGCWNFWTQAGCQQSSNASMIGANKTDTKFYINKSCTWTTSSSGWCQNVDCWSFDGTNAASCVNNTFRIKCTWNNECVGPMDKQCWNYRDATNCSATSGCEWGSCFKQGCWGQTNATSCRVTTGFNGKTCTWNLQYSECREGGCNNDNYPNSTACAAAGCKWGNSMCSDYTCGDLSFTNAATCVNTSASSYNLSCKWNNPFCEEKGCWNHNTQALCKANNATGCTWETFDGGYCQEAGCWNWDNITLGGTASSAGCLNNATAAGLSCIYDPNGGWCFQNISSKSCADYTGSNDCFNSFYCMWNFTNTTHGNCRSPDQMGGNVVLEKPNWNPGCYIFPNSGNCSLVIGCTWNATLSKCLGHTADAGVNCSLVNSSTMCNSIPSLSTCCAWNGTTGCIPDSYSTTCWDQMQAPPAGAGYCEDYEAYKSQTLCDQIRGSPWYMPCTWNNNTQHCEFSGQDVFIAGKENFLLIDSKQTCQFAGGYWVSESYCDNSSGSWTAIATGRCEFKFEDETNCDKACFACEKTKSGTNHNSSADAETSCLGSALGMCKFTASSAAANGFGTCRMKDEFKLGSSVQGDCQNDCSACTYKGDPQASDSSQRPSYFCTNSKKGCKWIPDFTAPTDESKGRCTSIAEKGCDERCDKCYDQSTCTNQGGKKGDLTLTQVKCEWSSDTYMCTPVGGGEYEVCWDGIDNNNDMKMDCADNQCFSDPFCGGGFMGGTFGNCFGYNNQSTCEGNSCAWVNETWGAWCDMPGAACWKRDGTNETYCEDDDANNVTCEWHSGFGGFCEDNWAVFDSCLNLDYTHCGLKTNVTYNCTWINDTMMGGGGGKCDPQPPSALYNGSSYSCYLHDMDGQAVCEAAGTAVGGVKPCKWFSFGWGGGAGHCDHVKFSCMGFNNLSTCNALNSTAAGTRPADWCNWSTTGNYCMENFMMGGGGGAGDCWNHQNSNACTNAGCNWVSGFCDPKGFGGEMTGGFSGGGGGGGGFGGDGGMGMGGFGIPCEAHNGEQSACQNQTGCGWFPDPVGFCDMNDVYECPSYWNEGNCTIGHPTCIWDTASGPGRCDFKVMQCMLNQTFQFNQNACENNATYCIWAPFGGCSPKCFYPGTTQTACNNVNLSTTNGNKTCAWVNGYCGSAMGAQFFKNMEGGAPIPLGTDASGDAGGKAYVDITSFGMKDMGMSYGFGMIVVELRNASMCNGVSLGSGQSGSGTNTTKFYWYLDTEGTRTGHCSASHNSSEVGFEFKLSYIVSWDSSQGSASEVFTGYRCLESSGTWEWAKTDLKMSNMKTFACTEIGGGSVAVEKMDLQKFPALYSPAVDIRVLVSTGDETHNSTHPSDYASGGFMTPGSVDFDLGLLDMYSYQSNGTASVGQQYAQRGFIGTTADCWTAAGCADQACYNHTYCANNRLGVHAAGYSNTKTPKVVGVVKETYPDAAFMAYYTDKPANGTVYVYSDASCKNAVDPPVFDIGTTSSNAKPYKLWHTAEFNNEDWNAHDPTAITPGETYYYQLKVCDDKGKCGISKCTTLVLETSPNCGFCNFVTTIGVSEAGWNVAYDLDQNGVYEHVQGSVCGSGAGMLTNYITGRDANIKLYNSDNTTWIEFIGAHLLRSGLTSKTAVFNTSSAFLNGTRTNAAGQTMGYGGMPAETRDKILNYFFPEKCKLKIPRPTGTNCTELWHCNENLTTCINITSSTTLNSSGTGYCIWNIPYCEFSAYAGGNPGGTSGDTGGDTGGGGGGGGGNASAKVASTKVWTTMSPDTDNVMKIYTASIGLDQITFQVSESVANAEVTVTKLNEKPADVAAEAAPAVYRYIDITKKALTDSQLKTATFKFHVEKSWLTGQGGSAGDVRLYRYTTAWNELATTHLSAEDDDTYHYFEATAPGLSYFAIGLKTVAAEEVPEEVPEEEGAPEEQPPTGEVVTPPVTPPGEGKTPLMGLLIGLAVVVVIGIAGYLYWSKQRR